MRSLAGPRAARGVVVRGARQNNLRDLNVTVPRNRLVCFIGRSGSGKSTLAFDIIAREGQRQYFESLPAFGRRFLNRSSRPDVDEIHGLSSTIVLSQQRSSGNPRSTVGTITEANTYLRLLFSRVGMPSLDSSEFSFNNPAGACPTCKGLGEVIELDPRKLIDFSKSLNEGALRHGEWRVNGRMWKIIDATRYFDMDRRIADFSAEELDRLLYAPKQLWQEDAEYGTTKWTYQGIITRLTSRGRHDGDDTTFSGIRPCRVCDGLRLNNRALAVRINGYNIGEVGNLPIPECLAFIRGVDAPAAKAVRPWLESQLEHLNDIGLGYLSLYRRSDTLSGGESQRVRMARQLGCNLVENIYVLDEPTAGLHPRDVDCVLATLRQLRDAGNTVLVVEHDEQVIRAADYLIELGPGAGVAGGRIVATGTPAELQRNPDSVTAPYLAGISPAPPRRLPHSPTGELVVVNATANNLDHVTVRLPAGVLIALTGVSGSGKSSLVEELRRQHPTAVTLVDQSPVAANKRACVGTYTGILNVVRRMFARATTMPAGLFSYNGAGACAGCAGLGFVDMEMHYLGDVRLHCEACDGRRYRDEALRYRYRGQTIADVLAMTAAELAGLCDQQAITARSSLLVDVGLDYLKIGQALDTLSGGEAQRLKLASRLRQSHEWYVLDEPTAGLHFTDIDMLLRLLDTLIAAGNTVLVVEHNLTVIAHADWIVDLGPEGGAHGGRIVASGTPNDVAASATHTGRYLRAYLDGHRGGKRER